MMKFFSKSFIPVRSYLVSDSAKYTFHNIMQNALEKSRQFLRIFFRKDNNFRNQYRYQYRLPFDFPIQNANTTLFKRLNLISFRPGFIQKVTSRWAANSLVGNVSKKTAQKVIRGAKAPMICFIGFTLAKKPSILTDEQELEGVTYAVRDAFSQISWQRIKNYEDPKIIDHPLKLSNLKFGDLIAKGCNAAVYSASLESKLNPESINNSKWDEKGNELKTEEKLIISHSEGGAYDFSNKKELVHTTKEDIQIPRGHGILNDLAVKIMFNYSIESNAFALWSAMYKETLPLSGDFGFENIPNWKIRKRRMPPHPNIVEMYGAFADQTPLLPGAFQNYPQALPQRLFNEGCGRNMTLFIVMKYYNCNLKDYLKDQVPSSYTSLLILTQIFEGLVHLLQHDIAHRDLKTDNMLLDLKYGIAYPRLVIADFGCCTENLCLSYPSDNIDKGGNMALMAPEIIEVEPGPFAVINYSRADLWTAGTLAYEIYGALNPFLTNSFQETKNMNDLPPFPSKAQPIVKKLIKDILKRNPSLRPSQNFAATVCQMLLHAPTKLLNETCSKKLHDAVIQWVLLISSKNYLQFTLQPSKINSLEYELQHTFLSRIQFSEVRDALNYIVDN